MALVKCTECGKEISDKAGSCPACGNPLSNQGSYVPNSNLKSKTPKRNRKAIPFIILALAAIGVIGAMQQKKNHDNEKSNVISQTEATKINIGDVIKNEYMELTINSIEFKYDVTPDNKEGFYTHYEADQGDVYICIDADIKNLGKQNINCDEIGKVTADYNNGYDYKSFIIVEDSNTGFTYSNITSITPLDTKGIRFLIKCPQEVEELDNPVVLSFSFANNKDNYTYKMK